MTNNLPANLNNMASALRQSADISSGGADSYLKCSKGEWIYGAANVDVEENSTWAVNPLSFEHGYVAWGSVERGNQGVNVGEVMVPAVNPIPAESSLPEVNGSWSKNISMQLKCLTGEDRGTSVVYKANSQGAKSAYSTLLAAIVDKIEAGDSSCVPIVNLETDSYRHATYGKIYVPVFCIKAWTTIDTDGYLDDEPEAPEAIEVEVEAEPEAPTRRRRVAT